MANLILYALLFLALLISVALQSTLFNLFEVYHIKPDLVLLVVILTGLFCGPSKGVVIGFLGGLLEGTLVGQSFGSFLISRALSGYVAGRLQGRIVAEKLSVLVFSILFISLFNEIIFYLLSVQAGFGQWLKLVLLKGLYNSLFGVLIAICLLRLRRVFKRSLE